jgi:hypothetical protein
MTLSLTLLEVEGLVFMLLILVCLLTAGVFVDWLVNYSIKFDLLEVDVKIK